MAQAIQQPMARDHAVVRAEDMSARRVIERLKMRGEKLKTDRGTLNSHLEEIATVIYPNGQGFVGKRASGEKRQSAIYDETGITANRLLAASMHGMATNPASKWFSVRMVDDDLNENDEVKNWLSAVEKKLYAEMYAPGTNLTPSFNELYLELGAFGTAAMFIGQTTTGGLQFQTRALAECYIAENADGVVDTLYRYFTYKVHQVMDMADWTPSDKVQTLFQQGKLDDDVQICHAVYPRDGFDPNRKGKKNMAFASCYFEVATCHELEQSGFPEFPYVCPRWEKAAGELYGRGPGMEALPAVKMLQAIEVEIIKIMQKLANPVRYYRDDGVTGQIRSIPGGINFWRGNPGEGIMLEPTSDKVPITLEWVEGIRNRIRTIFGNDTLQIVDQREMTLGEARMRKMERMRLQGPNIGRLDAEMLGPLVSRVYGILERKGMLPPAPEAINGKPVTVEFVSPLANAQKQEQLGGLAQVFDYIAPLGEMGLAALGRKLNTDRLIEYLWDVLNNDPQILNTDEEMQVIAQQEQMAKNMQAAQPIADAANKGAGAVKQLADAHAGGGVDMGKAVQRLMQGAQASNIAQRMGAA